MDYKLPISGRLRIYINLTVDQTNTMAFFPFEKKGFVITPIL